MSATRDNGGPAFPAPDLGEQDFSQPGAYPGMTLRDYFIANAPTEPQSWFCPVMSPFPATPYEIYKWRREYKKQWYIQWPSAWADEMLKARAT